MLEEIQPHENENIRLLRPSLILNSPQVSKTQP